MFPLITPWLQGRGRQYQQGIYLMKFVSLPHPSGDAVASPALRRLAWFNIAVQVAFPLAVAFPPAMAGEQHFLPQPAPLSTQRTQVYTLGPGETAISVAKKIRSHPEPAARAQSVAHLRARTQWSAVWG
ncbi:TPA: hypothetical protein ACXZOX_001480 [Salmonella enterica]